MARSPKDDPVFGDMHAWKYRETSENCAPGVHGERKQPQIPPNASVMSDNSVYTSYGPDVYMNKMTYNVQAGDTANRDDQTPYNNMQPGPRAPRQNYGNAMLNLGNGQLVRVFYDENNQQLIFPMNSSVSQYELFNNNQGLRDMPLQTAQPSHMFTLNQNTMNNNVHMPPNTVQNNNYNENAQNVPTSNFLKEVLGNWEPNSSGTYSPFGQNYPLNHPDAPTMNIPSNNPVMDQHHINQGVKAENSPKRNENSPLADTSNKKRIVAEVKPMRPSYSDVLAKNTKNNAQNETTRKVKPQNIDAKPNNKGNTKSEKPMANVKHDDNKHKNEKKLHTNTISSGSESGDINTEDMEKHQKPSKKCKNKRSNISRKWSSLDDIANEEDVSYNSNESQFVFIENNAEKPSKKDRKCDNKSKNNDKHSAADNSFKLNEDNDNSQFVYQDGQSETKSKKKKEPRTYHKTPKPSQDKKKGAQTKLRRNKPGYLGLAQNYLEHWGGATWKAAIWFLYLLSDICGMSANLLFDL